MYDVITLGTATRDIFVASPLFKVVKDPQHLKKIGFISGEVTCFALGAKIEIKNKPLSTSGGGAANAATTFSRQGLKTAAVVKLGKDESARNIADDFKKETIAPFIIQDKKLATASSVILLAPDGERTVLVYRGASQKLSSAEIPWKNLKSRWVYLAPGGIAHADIQKIVQHFSQQQSFIALNPSKALITMGLKKLAPILKKVQVFILNREEGAYLTGLDYAQKEKIFQTIDEAVGGILIMTDGQNGVLASDGKQIYRLVLHKKKPPVDETGAGDAFGSGFVAGLIHANELCLKGQYSWQNIKYALNLGLANANSVVAHIGAQDGIITKRKFDALKTHPDFSVKIYRSGI